MYEISYSWRRPYYNHKPSVFHTSGQFVTFDMGILQNKKYTQGPTICMSICGAIDLSFYMIYALFHDIHGINWIWFNFHERSYQFLNIWQKLPIFKFKEIKVPALAFSTFQRCPSFAFFVFKKFGISQLITGSHGSWVSVVFKLLDPPQV